MNLSTYGIPRDELGMQQKEAYEPEGKMQCDTCLEWKPIDEVKAHAGECQECYETSDSLDASGIEWMNAPLSPKDAKP